MKLSRTAIKELTAAYRAVLKHALIASMGAVVVMPAMAVVQIENGQEISGKTNENKKDEQAAGLTITYGDSLSESGVNGVLFSNNSSVNSGGAMKALNGFVAGDGWKFANNHSDKISGGLYVKIPENEESSRDVAFGQNTKFTENDSNWLGGALGIETAGTVTIGDGAEFTSNSTKADGGAIAIWTDKSNGATKGTELILGSTTFTGNKAINRGGALAVLNNDENKTDFNNTVEIAAGSSFNNNSAKLGGAVYNIGTINIDGTTFDGNIAEHSGGAIRNENVGTAVISNSEFTNNTALHGGAINNAATASDVGGNLTVTDSKFANNIGWNGGAIRNQGSTEIDISSSDISGSTFSGNESTNGGAIWNGEWGKLSVANATFENNHAELTSDLLPDKTGLGQGGAITNNGTVELTDVSFKNNTAATAGGAILNDKKGNITFNGTNTFTGNTAEVGADIFNNGQLTIADGTTTIDGGIAGNGVLGIADGATLNIGDATVEQKSIALDGNMIANLSDRGDKAIVTADEFTGNGKMSLIAKGEGEYKVFGGAAFAGEKEIDVNSVLYHLDWENDGTTVKLGLKSVQDIAGDNGLSSAASQTVMNIVSATSEKLNDFGLLVQEHLSNGDVAAVEKAHKVINPAEASAVQSVTSHIQGTVTKLAANRMSVPTFTGRSGGDMDVTAGGVWAQGLFNKSKKNGEFNGYTRGVAAGIDGTINRAFTIGAGYAFNHSDMDLDSRDTEIDSNTIFVYGQYKPSAWYANATLNYTMSDYEESGSALGVAVKSDYKINAFGGQVMTGYDFANGLTPEMGVRYLHVGGDTYTNSLGIKNKIDDADYLTAILGGKYAKVFAVSRELSVRPEVRLAAKYDMLSDEYDTAVAMPGINSYSVRGDRLNRFGGEAGLGVTMSYKDVDLSLTYDIEVRKDYTSQTGMVKARYNF